MGKLPFVIDGFQLISLLHRFIPQCQLMYEFDASVNSPPLHLHLHLGRGGGHGTAWQRVRSFYMGAAAVTHIRGRHTLVDSESVAAASAVRKQSQLGACRVADLMKVSMYSAILLLPFRPSTFTAA